MAQLRNTQQKKIISDLMADNFTHPTADDIYFKAREFDPHISRGTVYRNLNLLSEQGVIQKITVYDGADHFDSRTDRHYHFTCEECGKMYDIPLSYYDHLNDTPAEMAKEGFAVNGHRLMLSGLCPNCSNKSNV